VLEDLERFGCRIDFTWVNTCFVVSFRGATFLIRRNKIPSERGCKLQRIRQNLKKGKPACFVVDEDGTLRFQNQLWLHDKEELKEKILFEAHNTRYSVHPRDLKQYLWWDNMKREIAKYMNRFLTCQKVKAEHQRSIGELRPLEIPTWKWYSSSMDFIMGLPLSASKKNAIWVIVDRLTKSAHFLSIHDTWCIKKISTVACQRNSATAWNTQGYSI